MRILYLLASVIRTTSFFDVTSKRIAYLSHYKCFRTICYVPTSFGRPSYNWFIVTLQWCCSYVFDTKTTLWKLSNAPQIRTILSTFPDVFVVGNIEKTKPEFRYFLELSLKYWLLVQYIENMKCCAIKYIYYIFKHLFLSISFVKKYSRICMYMYVLMFAF